MQLMSVVKTYLYGDLKLRDIYESPWRT
jgi:hypothetical protein